MNHSIFNLAKNLGICDESSLVLFNKGVRDRPEVNAYRCEKSGVIILDDISKSTSDLYLEKRDMEYFDGMNFINLDDEIRADEYRELIRNKNWLDFGCGQGGPSILLRDVAKNAHGLEVQPGPRKHLSSKGIKCLSSLEQADDNFYDFITMFHVFEHLDEPISVLKQCWSKLTKNGRLIIEVPHANDALLSLYSVDAFKQFVLWSEHLILHTHDSLRKFIEHSGFKVDTIRYLQRYPLSNHLHWLSREQPNGHLEWAFLNDPHLNKSYGDVLASIGKTDSLVAYCRK